MPIDLLWEPAYAGRPRRMVRLQPKRA